MGTHGLPRLQAGGAKAERLSENPGTAASAKAANVFGKAVIARS